MTSAIATAVGASPLDSQSQESRKMMKPMAEKLGVEDMILIAAHTASFKP